MVARLRDIRLHPYDLPLRSAWTVSSGKTISRQGWAVEIVDRDGVQGLGDCPADVPGHPALSAAFPDLDRYCRSLVDMPLDEALALGASVGPIPAAVECALMDIAARRAGVPLFRRLHERARAFVAVNAVASLGGGDESPPSGFQIVKYKVGVAPVEEELAALRRLKLAAGVSLRLDANRAWTADQAQRFLDGLGGLPIDSVEEPLVSPTLKGLADLQAKTPILLALDESLAAFGGGEVLAARPVRRLVLKLGTVGGIGPTLEFVRKALAAGLDCVVTSRVESAVGVAAGAHLASALDAVRGRAAAHGLATSDWLLRDICAPPVVANGYLRLSETGGLGVALA